MKGIIESAFLHSRTVLTTLVFLLIAGAYTYGTIPKEAEPDVNIPMIIVGAKFEGISPEDAENMLVRPLELELRAIEGIKELRAQSFEGGANLILEFEAGFDSDQAMRDVREKVDLAKPDLPADTDEPTVDEVNLSLFPVVVVTLFGNVPERTMIALARDLKDSLEGITSVLKAEIGGDREEMIEVLIDPVKVESYGLSPAQATAAVKRSNILVAAGAQDTGQGRFSIKVPGLFKTVMDVMQQPVMTQGDAVVRLMDIAEVRRTYKDPTGFARVNGKPALTLEVSKRLGSNIIDMVERVRETVAEEQQQWPESLREQISVSFTQDKSKIIKSRISDLENNVISAVVLVMIVVVAALGLRAAGLVGLSIPGSFLTGVLVLHLMGMTLNVVVLFGLLLSVGILVDGAIVVTEFADRKMTEGLGRRAAYSLAAKRMAGPIIASTLTTLAAFLPLIFWPGVVGEFMKYLPITLVATLSASLLMALVFVPTLGGHLGRPGAADPETMKALSGGDEGHVDKLGGFTGKYIGFLKMALQHPGKVLLASVALLVLVQGSYAVFGHGVEFFPKAEPEFTKLDIRARGNLSIMEKDAITRQVEQRILPMKEIKTAYALSGHRTRGDEVEDIIGTLSIELVDWNKRRSVDDLQVEFLERTADMAGVIVDSRVQRMGPPVGKPVHLRISSNEPDRIEPVTEIISRHFQEMSGLVGLEDSRPLPGIDWVIDVDRAQAAKFGADISQVGSVIRLATSGVKLGSYRPDDSDDEIDIRARFPERYRTLEQLDHMRISSTNGTVPISNFVERKPEPRVNTLTRIDGKRVMTVKADVEKGVLADSKVQELHTWLASAGLDPKVKLEFKGEDEEQAKARAFLMRAFAVALFVMAIILVTQFNSFYSGFLILSAVVMSTIGVFIGLLITGRPFGIVMSGIGVIALAGIVVNNNIVLIDTYDHLVKQSGNVRDAILRTGAQRLRPVLLTTATTILGLAPMVMGIGVDFVGRDVVMGSPTTQLWVPLSTAIVFGLAFSTVLTLVVTPSALMFRENIRQWRFMRRHKRQTSEA